MSEKLVCQVNMKVFETEETIRAEGGLNGTSGGVFYIINSLIKSMVEEGDIQVEEVASFFAHVLQEHGAQVFAGSPADLNEILSETDSEATKH
ncbi:hypothetical protein THIOSC15_10007 [uncultured Thiomicrorhabdus sp.]